jgi:hypothetical protein
MNVKLPNGQIVKNVPDGTTKEQLAEKLNNSSIVSSWENNESTFTGEKIDVAFYNGPKSELWSTDKAEQYKKEIASGTSKEDAWKKTGILEGTAGVGLREDIGFDGLKFKTGKATRLGDDTSFVFNLKNVGTTNLNETWIGEGYMKKDAESGEYYFTKRNALTTVGETIEHPTLFKHYPWLKDIPIELVNPSKGNWDNYTELINEEQSGMAGGYYPGKDKWEGELGGTAEAGIEVIENKPVRIVLNVSSGTTAESIKDTLVEEIQHLLDDYENDNYRSVRSFEKEVNAQSTQNQLANPGLPPFAVNGKTDQEAFADEYYKNGSPKNNLEALHYVRIDLLNRVDNKYTRDYPRRIKEERKKEIARYYNKDGTVKKEYDEQDVIDYIKWFDKNLGLDDNEKYAEILAERELLKKPTKGPEPSAMMPSVYKWEGGYQQMKKDSGNYTTSGKLIGTNKGISAKTLESYLGREPTVDDMKNLDEKTISKIYKEEFYERYKIDKLPKELQTVAMHALVTGGPKTIKYLQELAGTKQDMLIGDATIKALKEKGITAEQLKNKILSEYKEFDNWGEYGNGWTNRFNDIVGKGWTHRANAELNGYY